MKLQRRPKGLNDLAGRTPVKFKTVPKNVERLVAVAIQRDGETHHGFKAHWELRASLGDENPHERTRGDREGFWTSAERFVGRYEASDIGLISGQVFGRVRELLSSDVDWDSK